jgi:hypothetical protein
VSFAGGTLAWARREGEGLLNAVLGLEDRFVLDHGEQFRGKARNVDSRQAGERQNSETSSKPKEREEVKDGLSD